MEELYCAGIYDKVTIVCLGARRPALIAPWLPNLFSTLIDPDSRGFEDEEVVPVGQHSIRDLTLDVREALRDQRRCDVAGGTARQRPATLVRRNEELTLSAASGWRRGALDVN